METARKSRLLYLLLLMVPVVAGLRLGAFNVRVFGQSKTSKEDVMNVLARVSSTAIKPQNLFLIAFLLFSFLRFFVHVERFGVDGCRVE